ncbi:MAG TPA: alkaline phosphatase family protein [Solirubrobacterales bacterium]|nr:alkaline phosphatase family protein [Solirubrobacterales bacterium]
MTGPIDEESERGSGDGRCAECDARLSPSQRYCIECGARRGPLPEVVGERAATLKERGRRAAKPPIGATPAPAEPAVAEGGEDDDGFWSFMPSPQVAAVAVMALLAAGVVIGSVTSPLASSAGFAPIILRFTGDGGPPPPEAEEAVEEAPELAPEVASVPTPAPVAAAVPETPEPEPEATPPPPLELPPELEEPELPPVKHVFLVVLGEGGYEDTFGKASTSTYFQKTLPEQGELIANYYAVSQGRLANQIALLSGQGPTPETVADCPEPTPIVPGTLSAEKQVEGSGCVYPKETPTLPAQLTEAKLTWRSYAEDLSPEGCADAAHRTPLLYFAAIAEDPKCGEADVPLTQLETDLKDPKTTPTLSYIVPNACHDGSETPCAPEQPAGLAGAQAFLEALLPKITASTAYREDGGLIAITFAQAPQSGEKADASSCCATPEYPNLPPPPAPAEAPTGPVKAGGGGGHVGLLLISPFVKPATVEESGYFNHFSLLLSIEELLELEPIGYAANPALTAFESEVFNAGEEEESTVTPRPQAGSKPQAGSSSKAS